MKIHYLYNSTIAVFVVTVFAFSTNTYAVESTISSNQLCPRGGYTCAVETPPTLSTFTFVDDLYEGMQGQDVLMLQQYLNKAGFFNGPFLGYFGTSTTKAVIDMQKLYGISPAKGYFGPKTKLIVNALNHLHGAI